eukprot:3013366-Alexandrium_andersonii.AAC.1
MPLEGILAALSSHSDRGAMARSHCSSITLPSRKAFQSSGARSNLCRRRPDSRGATTLLQRSALATDRNASAGAELHIQQQSGASLLHLREVLRKEAVGREGGEANGPTASKDAERPDVAMAVPETTCCRKSRACMPSTTQ